MEHIGEGVTQQEHVPPEVEKAIKDGKEWVDEAYNTPERCPHIKLTVSTPEDRPSKHSPDYDPRLLKELFPPEESGDSYILGIIAIHGNEPSIMTATIAAEINDILKEHNLPDAAIVLPEVYPQTKRILLEEFPEIAGRIYLSADLGALLKQTEFSRAGYQSHMRSVAEKQPQVQDELYEFLAHPFSALSLAGEEREFQPRGKRLEINAGANVTASEPGKRDTDFIFPVTLSDLVKATLTDRTVGKYFNTETLEQVLKYAEDIESRYRTTQIPYVHTLSANPIFSPEGKILTPHIKRSRRPSPVLAKDAEGQFTVPSQVEFGKGIYVMGSGSDIGKEVIEDLAEQYDKARYDIIAPKWFNLQFGKAAIPDVIFHPEVKAVLGRYGWGIGWMSQEAEKPFLSMPHLFFDNPEMHFNIQAMQEYGLGREFNDRLDIIEDLIKLQPGIHELNERIRRELQIPEGVDGIRFTAMNILQTALNAVSQKATEAEQRFGY